MRGKEHLTMKTCRSSFPFDEISMIQEEPLKKLPNGLYKTLKCVLFLLCQEHGELDYAQIHHAKSLLYASIERINPHIEALSLLQRRLRELLVIVTSLPDPVFYEKEAGKQIVGELLSQYSERMMWNQWDKDDEERNLEKKVST